MDDNKRVKWCPSVPHCGHAIRSKELHCEVCGWGARAAGAGAGDWGLEG